MSYVRVDLVAEDTHAPGVALTPTVFKIVSTDGKRIFGTHISDDTGHVRVLLPLGTYEVRAFHFGVDFGAPKLIGLLNESDGASSPIPLNSFILRGEGAGVRESTDPRYCVASGFFRGANGAPHRNLDLEFSTNFSPVLVDGSAVMQTKVQLRTDDNGFASVQLLRGAIYQASIQGMEWRVQNVYVPDQKWINLPDLLFPRLTRLVLNPEGSSLTVQVGSSTSLGAKLESSDGRTMPDLTSDADWVVQDSTIAQLDISLQGLRVIGLKAGQTQIDVIRRASSTYSIPDVPVQNTPILVTVTA